MYRMNAKIGTIDIKPIYNGYMTSNQIIASIQLTTKHKLKSN